MIEKNIIIKNLNVHLFQSDFFSPIGCTVFLHGWGSEASHLRSVFENSKNFIAVDLPGFGKSEKPKNAWTTGEYADFLGKLLGKLKIIEPVLVGHSFGGSVIIKFCSKESNVKKVILIGSAGIRNKSKKLLFYKIGARLFNAIFCIPGLRNLKKKIRRRFYLFLGSEDYLNAGEMRGTFNNIINEDLRADMEKVDLPVVLIWGEDDKETPISDAFEMKKIFQNANLFTIANAGHYVFLDRKEDFNKIFSAQFL